MRAISRCSGHVSSIVMLALLLLGTPSSNANAKTDKVGLLVVDVQQHFIDDAMANPATATALEVTYRLLHQANAQAVPVFVTYESSSQGTHAMPDDLSEALPLWHRTYVKTRYAATDLPALVHGLKRAGVTRIVLLGSETDVCVLLTALGLRQLGYDVLLVKDGVFSSKQNVTAAMERMRQAGVLFGDHRDAERAMTGLFVPDVGDNYRQTNLMIAPLVGGRPNAALILSATVPTTDPADGCSIAPRVERFRELLLLAEWLELPVYVSGNVGEHADWAHDALGFSTIGDHFERRHVRPLEDLEAHKYAHLIVAGNVDDLTQKLARIGAPRRLFTITDAAFSGQPDTLPAAGFVPLSYKTFYREVTGSVSYDDWPAKWVSRKQTFVSLLKDPETLRPVDDGCRQLIGDSLETQTR